MTRPGLEGLERRELLTSDLRFAVIGDYSAGQGTRDVSNQINGWNPSFVASVGDNNYPNGAAATIDANVGPYFHQYMSPYPDKNGYGPGSPDGVNHFFPAPGHHDWNPDALAPSEQTLQPYLDYFTGLPQNGGGGRYYTTTQGNVQLFVIDSDPHEPDLLSPANVSLLKQNPGLVATVLVQKQSAVDTSNSVEGQWLKTQLAASTAQWKLVVFHEPAYSSGDGGNNNWMQWAFQNWGATAVISGHSHDYERLNVGGLPYFVDGLGGESIVPFFTGAPAPTSPIPGSQVRYDSDFGAMLVDATSAAITFEFVTRTGTVIDSYTVGAPAAPSAPKGLVATTASATEVDLAWTDTAVGEGGFYVERSTSPFTSATPTPTGLPTVPSGVTTYKDTTAAPGIHYYYRVRAVNAAGTSSASNVADATTLGLPAGPPTYVSDLTWIKATNGVGPPKVDLNNNGGPIILSGVTYAKGVGLHPGAGSNVSEIDLNLAGKYSIFTSDVGIDQTLGLALPSAPSSGSVPGTGSVDFQVKADGKIVYDSGLMLHGSPTKTIDLNVAGVQTLALIVNDAGDGNSYDYADFGGARLYADTAPPTTTAVLAGPSSAPGTFTGPVLVTLSAVDPTSLLAGTQYRIDNGAWQAYTGPFTISGSGNHTVAYFSTNLAGVVETTRSQTFAIDLSPKTQTPQSQIGSVLTDLITLRSADSNKNDDHKLDDAIANLGKSLGSSLWIDGSHLQPNGGSTFFDAQKHTFDDLQSLLKKSALTPAQSQTVQGLINRLLSADLQLLAIAITAATGGDPNQLSHANDEFARGNSDIVKGNDSSGINHYKNAWQQASNTAPAGDSNQNGSQGNGNNQGNSNDQGDNNQGGGNGGNQNGQNGQGGN